MGLPESVYEVPQELPGPEDDGACNHLPGRNAEEVVHWLSERTAS